MKTSLSSALLPLALCVVGCTAESTQEENEADLLAATTVFFAVSPDSSEEKAFLDVFVPQFRKLAAEETTAKRPGASTRVQIEKGIYVVQRKDAIISCSPSKEGTSCLFAVHMRGRAADTFELWGDQRTLAGTLYALFSQQKDSNWTRESPPVLVGSKASGPFIACTADRRTTATCTFRLAKNVDAADP